MIPAASSGVFNGRLICFEKPRFLKLFPLYGNPVARPRGIKEIKDYCRKKYDFIFSANGRKIMDDLLKQCNVSLDEVQKEQYRDHFIAAYFQLAGVAFSRTISRDLRYEVMYFSKGYLEEKKSFSFSY